MVENYLTLWSATVQSVAANEVVFDAGVYNAATSSGFWDIDADEFDGYVFTEESYDANTGEHVINLDHSSSSRNPTWVESHVTQRVDDVMSHENRVIQFMVTRGTVMDAFKADVKRRLRTRIAHRRYRLGDAVVTISFLKAGKLL